MTAPTQPLIRCAIYTRTSGSAGLDAPTNSIETQKEVCRAYIQCQAHRGWAEIPECYDDGGFSGGSLKRPALQRLIRDLEQGRVDIVVIYKVDRLSRSLTDFVHLMEILDRHTVSFASVTQTFDTSDSMGRLVLNILLTFAQFERELASERIRDRYEEQRRRGLYCGGSPPAGYLVRKGGHLVPDPERADTVRRLFSDYPKLSPTALASRLQSTGFTTLRYRSRNPMRKRRQAFSYSQVVGILRNPVYAGYSRVRGELVKAQIEPLIDFPEWQRVQDDLNANEPRRRDTVQNLLLGILFDSLGRRMIMVTSRSRTKKNNRFYGSQHTSWALGTIHRKVTVKAEPVEDLAISAIKGFLTDRTRIKKAILSLGNYSTEVETLMRGGALAARRVSLMERAQLRDLLLALVPRIEVNRTGLQMLVCAYELSRFLAWDGTGEFRRSVGRPRGSDHFHMVYAPGFLICGHSYFAIPIKGPRSTSPNPQPELIALLNQATQYRQLLLEHPGKSMSQLARMHHTGPNMFARVLRLNYLAPDIQASIMDGTHPAALSRQKLLFGPLPLDWGQQRHFLGFPTEESPRWVDTSPMTRFHG